MRGSDNTTEYPLESVLRPRNKIVNNDSATQTLLPFGQHAAKYDMKPRAKNFFLQSYIHVWLLNALNSHGGKYSAQIP